jgi:hypothetical protein
MNSKKIWVMWATSLILLTGCEEIHGAISFKKNGSGILNLRIVHPEDSKVDVETCRKLITDIEWSNVSHEKVPGIVSPGKDQCVYTYSFNDLDEVEKLYKRLGLKLDRLIINSDEFTYKSTNNECVNDVNPTKSTKLATWSVTPPGNIRLHNADKIIGDKLTWNISGLDCYDISVVSGVAPSLERLPEPQKTQSPESKSLDDKPLNDKTVPSTNSPSEKPEKQSLDSTVALWTAVGASVATILATFIAYMTYRDSKKKR